MHNKSTWQNWPHFCIHNQNRANKTKTIYNNDPLKNGVNIKARQEEFTTQKTSPRYSNAKTYSKLLVLSENLCCFRRVVKLGVFFNLYNRDSCKMYLESADTKMFNNSVQTINTFDIKWNLWYTTARMPLFI